MGTVTSIAKRRASKAVGKGSKQKAAGKCGSTFGAARNAGVQGGPQRGAARAGSSSRNSKASSPAGSGSGDDRQKQLSSKDGTARAGTGDASAEQRTERQGSEVDGVVRRIGPRRVLIFAPTFQEARAIAERKKYPRDLWRFVTGTVDVLGLDPREWATITVPGFGSGHHNRMKWDAYQYFQQRCRGYGVKVPSYDP